jgi:hypothetical protein
MEEWFSDMEISIGVGWGSKAYRKEQVQKKKKNF